MEKINILTIGRNIEIANILLKLINNNPEWQGFLAMSDDEAINLFSNHKIDLILFGSGIDEQSENFLRNHFKSKNPDIIILQHYGGGSGLLKNEIYQALAERK